MSLTRVLGGAILAVLLMACGSTSAATQGTPTTLSVFAAASLNPSIKAIAEAFQKQHSSVRFQFNLAGTPTLVTQIENGANADVFASADTTNMDKLRGEGLIKESPVVFAHNKLEIVVAPGNPKHITGLSDLAKPGVIYISAGPTVPAGKYAAQALAKAGVTVTPKSLETDVKSVVSKIELGEADAGIVYVTDVQAADIRVAGVSIPDGQNLIATYPIAALQSNAMATAFVTFTTSPGAQAILKSYGFLPA